MRRRRVIAPSATGVEGDDASLRGGGAYAHAILDAALDPFVTIDHRGSVLEFNRAAELTFGYRRADVLGRELAELIVPPEQREAHRRGLARWTASGPSDGAGVLLGRRLEVEAMRADGSRFPAEITIARVDVPGPPMFTACVRDVSERRQADERLRSAEFRYRTLVEQLPLVSYVDSPQSPVSNALYLSPQLEAMLGYTPEMWLATPDLYLRSIHPDDAERVVAARHRAYERGEELRIEYRMLTADGRTVWVEDRSVLVRPPEGGPPFRQGFALDVTERRHAEEALRRAETQYRTLVEQLPLAVYVDRLDDKSSNVYTSPQVEVMLGYSPEEWIRAPDLFVTLLHPEDREHVLAAHRRVHATGEPLQLDYRLRARNGRYIWVHDEARLIHDPATGEKVLQGYLLDVTARTEAERQLRHQAFHDPLTGLANRALFIDRLEHALALRAEHGGEVAVLFLDLDDLKAVNDSLGHLAGDALLELVGERLRTTLSPGDTISRLGGDEFAILVEDVESPHAVVAVAERLVASLQDPFVVAERQVYVTASIGITIGDDVEGLLRSADLAMYRAKSSGKAQYAVYAPWMDADVGALELVAELRRASIEDEFVVQYQPEVELATGVVVGLEALVRWRHPTRGLLAPSEFVPLAEETGRIVAIGRWVLAEACRQLAEWRRSLPSETLRVSVNVSPRQVRGPGLVSDVREALAAAGLPPDALVLEITESVLAHRRDEMRRVLDDVVGLGVKLALDDFGTGYSSLALLQDLPVHTLKIDRSFVHELERVPERRAFVRAIIELAGALGLGVVAEGIEDEAQARVLEQLGCRHGQGFHYAAPLAPDAVAELLAIGAIGRHPASGGTRAA